MEENQSFQKEKLQEDYNDAYWEQHYTICRERIPVFMERVADKILNTGKYLNVVRQCGKWDLGGNLYLVCCGSLRIFPSVRKTADCYKLLYRDKI